MDALLLPALKGQAGRSVQLYSLAYTYLSSYVLAFPALMAGIDAPHGKFADPKNKLNVNGQFGKLRTGKG
jgi:hypothetical protein